MKIEVPTLAELKEKNKKAEIVFWVGCAGSFDERAKKITKAFAKILILFLFAFLLHKEIASFEISEKKYLFFNFVFLATDNPT